MPYQLALITAAVLTAPTVQASQTQDRSRPVSDVTTKAEFTERLDARFSAFDANNDGRLDAAEVAAAQSRALERRAVAQQQRLEARFEQLDTNKDNQLSFAEFQAAAAPVRSRQTADQLIARLDSNEDGFVSPQEFQAGPLDRFDRADGNDDGVITAAERRQIRRRR